MKNIYVTFALSNIFMRNAKKIAVTCENMDDAREVGQDAYSLDGIKNVRIRKCGKPTSDRLFITYDEYFKYTWY